jgi:hypothetical protein
LPLERKQFVTSNATDIGVEITHIGRHNVNRL